MDGLCTNRSANKDFAYKAFARYGRSCDVLIASAFFSGAVQSEAGQVHCAELRGSDWNSRASAVPTQTDPVVGISPVPQR